MVSIAIDGPAGAGKSTIARAIAERLGYIYVDTGALYRAVGLYATANGIETTDEAGVERLLMSAKVELRHDKSGTQRVYLNGYDVSEEIRRPEISMAASNVSALPAVRQFLFALQQNLAMEHNVVMDGRDIGTAVLPNAPLKVYLTASAHVRALRRWKELTEKGQTADLAKIEEDINERDYQDMHREHSPLVQAEDAVLVDSSEMTIDEVVEKILSLARERM